jgi:metal-sulfur cluster biosynthetic enzyme
VQADGLDQRAHVGLRAAQPQRAALGSQALRETGEVDHHGRVGEVQVGEVDDDVAGRRQGSGQGPSPASTGRSVLISRDPQDRQLLVEVNDPGKLIHTGGFVQGPAKIIRTLMLMVDEEDVLEALSNVIDPELGLDFVELGLIYGVEIDGGRVSVTFTLTTPACPIGPQVSEQMVEFVGEVPGVTEVVPNMVFTPPWTPEKMSEDAKFALGY